MVDCTCHRCQVDFTRPAGKIREGQLLFHDPECYSIWQSEMRLLKENEI